MGDPRASAVTLVDAHVHVHGQFDVARLLDSAADNFERELVTSGDTEHRGAGQAAAPLGVLALTECAGRDWFAEVHARPGARFGRWRCEPNPREETSLRISDGRRRLHVLAGRQIVTREGIEVLALATRVGIADGQPLEATLAAVAAAGAVIVLPWGAGKWLGTRGRLIGAVPRSVGGQPVWFGDNGGRPWCWPQGPWLAAERAGRRPILSGSDPLPLAGEEARVGSVGIRFDHEALDESAPAAQLRRWLGSPDAITHAGFGRPIGALRFFQRQLQLRLAGKRRAAGSEVLPISSQRPVQDAPADIETSSADYASRFSGPAGAYLLSVQAECVRRALRGVPPGRALDVGGGHGQLVGVLRNLGWQVTVHGSDPVCERNLRELHGQRDVDFALGDMFALPVETASFDLVIAVRLVPHVEDWPRLLAEMCRVSRRTVLFDYPSLSGLNALTPLLFSLKKSLEGNTRTYLSFTRRQLADELARHGFADVREVKQFLLPMVVHRKARGAAPLRWLESLFRIAGLTALWGSPIILRADRRAAVPGADAGVRA